MLDTRIHDAKTPLEKRQLETRQRILNATLKMIHERGLDKVSWRAIARAVNYSPAGLYEYFENKDDIVATLAQSGLSDLSEAMRAVNPSLPLEERLVALGQAYVDYAHAHPESYALIFSVLPSRRRSASEPASGPYKQVLDLIQQGLDRGKFRTSTGFGANEIAYSFWSLVHGMASLQLSHLRGFDADFAEVDREAMKRFTTGLKT